VAWGRFVCHLSQKSVLPGTLVRGDAFPETVSTARFLIRVMLEVEGYRVYDLGSDVPLEQFIKKAKEMQANIIAMSSLMSTPMLGMEKVIDMLKEEGLRKKIRVIVGGASVSLEFAQKIGADGYAKNVAELLVLMEQLEKNDFPRH
jgi:dimethylamine corrinoid protein